MLRSLRAALLPLVLLLVAVLALACDDDEEPGDTTPSPAATSAAALPTSTATTVIATPSPATPAVTATPPSTATATAPSPTPPGVAEVTRAFATRDAAALAALARLTPIPCVVGVQGLGGPPDCPPPGVAAGTPLDVLPALLCEGQYFTRRTLLPFLQQQVEQGGYQPYGVLRVAAAPYAFPAGFPHTATWPVPQTAVVFKGTTFGLDLGVYLADGRIVALRSFGICGPALPPPSDPAWLTPPQP